MTEKKQPLSREQWLEIRVLYHAGQLSVSEIARQFGVTEGAIRKMARKYGWQRDLQPRVNQEIRRRLAAEKSGTEGTGEAGTSGTSGTNAEVREDHAPELSQPLTAEQEQHIVDQAASAGVAIVKLHRRDIRRAQQAVEVLMQELVDVTAHQERIAEIIVDMTSDAGRQRSAALRAISLPSRAGVARDLATAMARLVPLERQAFSLDDNPEGETYEQKLKRLMGSQLD